MSQTIKCPSCGDVNPPDSTFCGSCGTSLAGVQKTTTTIAPNEALPELPNTGVLPAAPTPFLPQRQDPFAQSLLNAVDDDASEEDDESFDSSANAPAPVVVAPVVASPPRPTPPTSPPPSSSPISSTPTAPPSAATAPASVPPSLPQSPAPQNLRPPILPQPSSPAPPASATVPSADMAALTQQMANLTAAMSSSPATRSAHVVYDYYMVQIPPNIALRGRTSGQEAAQYLQEICNQYANEQWEFYRVDTLGVMVSPGCLAALFGQRASSIDYFVVTFRRPRR